MSDYELASLANEYTMNGATHFMNFVAILFAFLVVSYFVGPKLTRVQAVLVSLLFTLFTSMMLSATLHSFWTSRGIRTVLANRAGQEGSELSAWFDSASATRFPLEIYSSGLVMILAYIAGIAFIIYMRRERNDA